MVLLKYNSPTYETDLWEEKLIELSVGYKTEQGSSQTTPVLEHGKEIHEGPEAISNYLIELEKFVYNWRRCACEG